MSGGAMAEQVATLKSCEAGLRQVAALLAGLLARRESAEGAKRVGEMIDELRRSLVYEFPALAAEQALDELVAADGWLHPTEALDAPCRDWELLLRFCDERLDHTTGKERQRLKEVRRKVARALRFAEEAKERLRRRQEEEADQARRRLWRQRGLSR